MPVLNPSGAKPAGQSGMLLFVWLLSGFVLACCAGWAALVLGSATWTEARQLDAIFPFYRWRIRYFTASELRHAWQLLAQCTLGTAGLLLLSLARWARARQQVSTWYRETASVGRSLWREISRLTSRQRRVAAGALAGLTALRTVLSHPTVTPGYDDVPSYEMFASKSLLAVSAYYPVPNNHVLSNTLNWVFYHLYPGFWFTMRLPVLLAATAATILFFAGLLKYGASFRAALLAVLLFGLAQLSLYHAAVGRGYWLLTLMAGVVFFCSLALLGKSDKSRAAWAGLALGGVLGTYAVPTFALVLASAFSWLGLGLLRQHRWRSLGHLTIVGSAVASGALLLYVPLLFVSGPASFFQNGFVVSLSAGQFWAGLPAYLWETEGFLAGQMKVGAVLTLLVLLAAAAGPRLLPTQAEAGTARTAWHRLVPAALWFTWLPYAVLAVQRVYAPGRTLLYKAIFTFIILSLAVDALLQARLRRQRRLLGGLLALGLLGWTTYQISSLERDNQTPRHRNAALHAAFIWLARQPPAPLLVPEPTHSLFVRMYLHSELPNQHWQIDARPQPGRRYTYVLAFPNQRGQFQPLFAAPPVFRNQQVEIYEARQLAPAAYWHMVN